MCDGIPPAHSIEPFLSNSKTMVVPQLQRMVLLGSRSRRHQQLTTLASSQLPPNR
jgi:hypothetical protein